MQCVINSVDVFVIIDLYLNEVILVAIEEYKIASNAFVAYVYSSSKIRLDPMHSRASQRRRGISR
jgi:hypothetical protein